MEQRIMRKKRPFLLFFFGIAMSFGLGFLLYTFSPKSVLPYPIPVFIQPIHVFFLFLFLSVASIGIYLFNHTRRGILLGLFVCCYLLLRLHHLSENYFTLILLSLFVSLELFFTRYH